MCGADGHAGDFRKAPKKIPLANCEDFDTQQGSGLSKMNQCGVGFCTEHGDAHRPNLVAMRSQRVCGNHGLVPFQIRKGTRADGMPDLCDIDFGILAGMSSVLRVNLCLRDVWLGWQAFPLALCGRLARYVRGTVGNFRTSFGDAACRLGGSCFFGGRGSRPVAGEYQDPGRGIGNRGRAFRRDFCGSHGDSHRTGNLGICS